MSIVADLDGWGRFKKSPKRFERALQRNFKKAFADHGREFVGAMVLTPGLRKRTSQLARSFGHKVSGSNIDELRLSAFSAGAIHARAQEHGAVITPKRSKWLTIPGPDNKTGAGVARMDARAWFAKHAGSVIPQAQTRTASSRSTARSRGPKRRRNYVMFRRRKGPGWVVWRLTPKTRKPVSKGPAWILVDRVVLPGPKTTGSKSRLGFFDTWNSQRRDRLKRNKKAVRASIKEGMAKK